mmetsp:Transcript_11058/g.22712  ORF Transcript_11058/g.22712 Transcript_11058/m.22712 type:complete len:277 (-) Transcript_11058:459-1289(-)
MFIIVSRRFPFTISTSLRHDNHLPLHQFLPHPLLPQLAPILPLFPPPLLLRRPPRLPRLPPRIPRLPRHLPLPTTHHPPPLEGTPLSQIQRPPHDIRRYRLSHIGDSVRESGMGVAPPGSGIIEDVERDVGLPACFDEVAEGAGDALHGGSVGYYRVGFVGCSVENGVVMVAVIILVVVVVVDYCVIVVFGRKERPREKKPCKNRVAPTGTVVPKTNVFSVQWTFAFPIDAFRYCILPIQAGRRRHPHPGQQPRKPSVGFRSCGNGLCVYSTIYPL